MKKLNQHLFDAPMPGKLLVEWLSEHGKEAPPFLAMADQISAGPKPWHSGSVLRHMARCMNETAGDPLAVWLAMAHDAGKLTTPKAMLPHHYGHELRGEILAGLWADELELPFSWKRAGQIAAREHMRAARYLQMRPGKRLSLLKKLREADIQEAFWKMVNADTRSCLANIALENAKKMTEWEEQGLSRNEQISLLKAENRQFNQSFSDNENE